MWLSVAVQSLAFSRNGAMLASAGMTREMEGKVALWNVQRGDEERPPLSMGGEGAQSVDFSPDDQMLAVHARDPPHPLQLNHHGGLPVLSLLLGLRVSLP